MPDLRLYTIKDIREWLINDNPQEGLSEHVIAPVRAFSILNNPYVQESDAVVAALYEGEEPAAYTACFPDMVDNKRIWWASTLWCNPVFQGKGYGLIVVGSLIEAHEGELTLDRWGARETVEIFSYLGYRTIYSPRYIFGDKSINRKTLKGKIAYSIQEIKKSLHSTSCAECSMPYTIKYSTFVDGETFAFMQTHRKNDVFLREQKMLNWILSYPFLQSCILSNQVICDTVFSSNRSLYSYYVAKIYRNNELIGIYVLRRNDIRLSVLLLYYEDNQKITVFASIVDHILKMKTSSFETEDKALADYVKEHLYFSKKSIEQVSFSYPHNSTAQTLLKGMGISTTIFQFGDGDSFA